MWRSDFVQVVAELTLVRALALFRATYVLPIATKTITCLYSIACIRYLSLSSHGSCTVLWYSMTHDVQNFKYNWEFAQDSVICQLPCLLTGKQYCVDSQTYVKYRYPLCVHADWSIISDDWLTWPWFMRQFIIYHSLNPIHDYKQTSADVCSWPEFDIALKQSLVQLINLWLAWAPFSRCCWCKFARHH